MYGDRRIIEDLRMELERLQSASRNIERLINEFDEQVNRKEPESHQGHRILNIDIDRRRIINNTANHPVVKDKHGTEILIGDKVRFLTGGESSSWSGVIYKISNSGARVMARDNNNRLISRTPNNVEIVAFRHQNMIDE